MSHTFMADQSMIPPLPMEPDPAIPAQPSNFTQGAPRPTSGVPKFKLVPMRIGGTFANVEYVDILTPGDPKATPCHKVTDIIRQMYPREYDAFRRGLEMAPDGWPLEMWPVLNPAQVYLLKSLNIFTVEQLSQVADSNLHRVPMGRTLRNQAQAALKAKTESDGVEAMRRKDEMNRDAIASLEASNAELMRQLADLSAKVNGPAETAAPAKRGPGRPPKNVEAT